MTDSFDEQQNAKNNKRLFLIAAVLVVVLVPTGMVVALFLANVPSTMTASSAGNLITYEISGTASLASVIMSTPGGSTEQVSALSIPWTRHLLNFRRGDHLYLSAQNKSRGGCVTVTILLDKRQLRTATSCGEHVIATTSAQR